MQTLYKLTWEMVTPQGQARVSQYGPLGGNQTSSYKSLDENFWMKVERIDTSPFQQWGALLEVAKHDDPNIRNVELFVAKDLSKIEWEEYSR